MTATQLPITSAHSPWSAILDTQCLIGCLQILLMRSGLKVSSVSLNSSTKCSLHAGIHYIAHRCTYLPCGSSDLISCFSYPKKYSIGLRLGEYCALNSSMTFMLPIVSSTIGDPCMLALSMKITTGRPLLSGSCRMLRSSSNRKFSNTEESTPPSISYAASNLSWLIAASRLMEYFSIPFLSVITLACCSCL